MRQIQEKYRDKEKKLRELSRTSDWESAWTGDLIGSEEVVMAMAQTVVVMACDECHCFRVKITQVKSSSVITYKK